MTSAVTDLPISPIYQVLIVEDDPQTRAYFASCVSAHAQLRVFAEAASVAQGKALLAQAAENPIDVLLTDLGLPDGSGLELIAYAAQHLSGCDSLVISMFGDEDNVLASIEAGATGYLHKDSASADIAQSILQLKLGQSPMSPMIARRLLGKFRSMSAAQTSASLAASEATNLNQNRHLAGIKYSSDAINKIVNKEPSQAAQDSMEQPRELPDGVRTLSKRELEVLDHISRGFSYAEVAQISHVSVHTVQTHIKNIYAKLCVHNRSEAVFEAQRLGLLSR
jgi:DNA-binding NarL/FixJ family response regulator